jgi:hypothetical protein
MDNPAIAPPSTDDPRSKLAAVMFPKEWARAVAMTGKGASKMRQRLRQAAETQVKLDALRRSGAACATCDSFKTKGGAGRPWCSYASDFHGYVTAKPDGLCTAYDRRA